MHGLTFGGKHSLTDYGLVLRSKNRPVMPDPKIVTDDVAGVDGSYDFTDYNTDGKTKYKDRIITVTFSLREKDSGILRVKAHQIARWLNCGESNLIFDDETAVYYKARVNNRIDLEKQIIQLQEFTVQFKCKPYAYSVIDSTEEQIQVGMDLQLGYGYKLNMEPTVYNIAKPYNVLTVYNPGDYCKNMIITIKGTASGLVLNCNSKTLTYTEPITAGTTLIIDFGKFNATLDGANVNSFISGDFFGFETGDNTLVVSNTSIDINLSIAFNYLYL